MNALLKWVLKAFSIMAVVISLTTIAYIRHDKRLEARTQTETPFESRIRGHLLARLNRFEVIARTEGFNALTNELGLETACPLFFDGLLIVVRPRGTVTAHVSHIELVAGVYKDMDAVRAGWIESEWTESRTIAIAR